MKIKLIMLIGVMGILLVPCLGQKVDIEVKTRSYGGTVAPRHAAAVWIQKSDDEFIKTLDVWSFQYNICLFYWRTASGLVDTGIYDAITQATLPGHEDPIKVSWDCKDTSGNLVPHGSYEFCVEFTEKEYWWKYQDPNEIYYGKYTKGTILIDDNDKVAYGDTSDSAFSALKATYSSTGILYQGHKPVKNNIMSYRYNPSVQQVTFQLNPVHTQSAALQILNVKGELIKTLRMNSATRKTHWNLTNNSGKKVPAGVYLINLHATDGGDIISQKFSITLLR